VLWVYLVVDKLVVASLLHLWKNYCVGIFGPALSLVFFGDSSMYDKNGTTSRGLWVIFRLCLSCMCPCIIFVTGLLMKLMMVTRPLKTFLWPNPQIVGLLILPYLITIDWYIEPCIRLTVQG